MLLSGVVALFAATDHAMKIQQTLGSANLVRAAPGSLAHPL
jgi:hypothetical protein